MRRLQRMPWTTAALVVVAGSSLASVGTKPEPIADVASVPKSCERWLQVPANTTDETLAWDQRLSLAACRQVFTVDTTSDPAKFRDVIAQIDRGMAPSVAMYRDVVARGDAPEVRILGAYNLGMAYLNTVVRARTAIHVIDGSSGSYGGAAYGATLDRYQILSRALEPLLITYRLNAVTAFDDVNRMAQENPEAATANSVMTYVVADAKRQRALLHPEEIDTTTRATW